MTRYTFRKGGIRFVRFGRLFLTFSIARRRPVPTTLLALYSR